MLGRGGGWRAGRAGGGVWGSNVEEKKETGDPHP